MKLKSSYKYYSLLIKLLLGKKVKSNYKSNIQIISITSHGDFLMLITALKSFLYYSNIECMITVVDDGTLRSIDFLFLSYMIRDVQLIRNGQIHKIIEKKLGIDDILYTHKNSPFLLKKLSLHLLSKKRKVLLLDSDLIFLNKPDEIIDWSHGVYDEIYMRDVINSYILSDVETRHYFGTKPIQRLNSGVIGILKKDLNITLLRRLAHMYFKEFYTTRTPHFQIYFAILFSRIKRKRKISPLSDAYKIPSEGISSNQKITCFHFTSIYRHLYHQVAFKILDKIDQAKQQADFFA